MDEWFRRSPTALFERLGEGFVVLDADSDRYVRLNQTGALIWAALEEPARIGDLAAVLVERHGLESERADVDVVAFIASLRERDLVQIVER